MSDWLCFEAQITPMVWGKNTCTILCLRPADPHVVATPDDMLTALRAAGRRADWQALTSGKQRGGSTVLKPQNALKRVPNEL